MALTGKKKKTVKIADVTGGDFIIIDADEFKAGETHEGHGVVMEKWDESKTPAPAPARAAGEAPQDIPQATRAAELKTSTVAELGPILAEEEDVEVLVRLKQIEKRTTVIGLIDARLEELGASDDDQDEDDEDAEDDETEGNNLDNVTPERTAG